MKDVSRHLIKEDVWITNKQMKYAWHYLSFKNYKLKLQGDITVCLLKEREKKQQPNNNPKLTILIAVKKWAIGTLILLLVGMQNGIDTLEDCLAVSYYAKQSYHTI